MLLPGMPREDGIRGYEQVTFRGYDHRRSTSEGGIFDMQNMAGDEAPILAPRKKRQIMRNVGSPNGLICFDGVYTAEGAELRKNNVKVCDIENSRKTMAIIGKRIVILPDKIAYNTETGEKEEIESAYEGAAKLQDGTYVGEEAMANTIKKTGTDFGTYFKAGDAVTISGCTIHPENNKTIIIREVDGDELRFYENSFTISEGGDSETNIKIARTMPDMDFLIENENRLWGAKGDTIYASKLGDAFNWNVFDGVATDSFAVDVGSRGDFTGAVSFLGYPVFFKEEYIYKVYGERPSNYQVMGSADLGVMAGAGRSLAIAGNILFYLSRAGVCAYQGGMPQNISEVFGDATYTGGSAASDGRKVYMTLKEGNAASLFCYDTMTGLWHREDDTDIIAGSYEGTLYILTAGGRLYALGGSVGTAEGSFQSFAEFGDFYMWSAKKKTITKIILRGETETDAAVTVKIKYDSAGDWQTVSTVTPGTKRSFYLPVIPHRCDHFRIRIEGTGMWRIYSITKETSTGSAN